MISASILVYRESKNVSHNVILSFIRFCLCQPPKLSYSPIITCHSCHFQVLNMIETRCRWGEKIKLRYDNTSKEHSCPWQYLHKSWKNTRKAILYLSRHYQHAHCQASQHKYINWPNTVCLWCILMSVFTHFRYLHSENKMLLIGSAARITKNSVSFLHFSTTSSWASSYIILTFTPTLLLPLNMASWSSSS